jgi:uncharacterized peroxidase-related enzyme
MRLSKKRLEKIVWYLKPFFLNQQRKYGQPLEPAKVWAMIPRLFVSVASVYGVLDRKKSPIQPSLRSLISIRVSQMNGCMFCVDLNSATLIKRTDSDEKLQALSNWNTSDVFSDSEKAALDYAEGMTITPCQVDDVCFHALKNHFDDKAIVELTALIAFQNMSSKFNTALAIAPQGFCHVNVTNKKT